jgi:hypothetical protein
LTIIIDDAGSGDLLFGVIIGAFRKETNEFRYGIIDVKYFKSSRFHRKEYLKQASKIVLNLLNKLKFELEEQIKICKGYIFDVALIDLIKIYGEDRIQRVKIIGKAQYFTELAYLDEIRNLGYEPIVDREEKRAKSFFHMMRWLKKNPDKLKYAKTGWPRLSRYNLFKSYRKKRRVLTK